MNEDLTQLQLLFPTAIYCAIIKNVEPIQTEMAKAVDVIKWHPAKGDWGKTHKLSTTDFNQNELEVYQLNNFKQTLDFHLQKYLEELRFPMTEYQCNSWFTRFDKGDYAIGHHHAHADISGVYYYQTNGQDGNIVFETPNVAGDTSLYFGYHNQIKVHPPLVGKLILFPGWLRHSVTMNTVDKERISFSFNIHFNRK